VPILRVGEPGAIGQLADTGDDPAAALTAQVEAKGAFDTLFLGPGRRRSGLRLA